MNEVQQLIASCQAHLADIDGNLSRVAALLGDAPKAEQLDAPVRYFYENKTLWRIEANGFGYCLNIGSKTWVPAGANLEILTESNTPEITAEQAEAILKGGGL